MAKICPSCNNEFDVSEEFCKDCDVMLLNDAGVFVDTWDVLPMEMPILGERVYTGSVDDCNSLMTQLGSADILCWLENAQGIPVPKGYHAGEILMSVYVDAEQAEGAQEFLREYV